VKIRPQFIGVLILLGLLAWWFWPRLAPPTIARTNPDGSPIPLTPAQLQDLKDYEMPRMLALMAKANRPIEFYGKVVDQNGNPIPSVKVSLDIKLIKIPAPGELPGDMFDTYTLTTDANGLFSLTGAKGELLTVESLEKTGYDAAHKNINKGYWYWASIGYVGNPKQPEIFQMWKRTGTEELVRKTFSTDLDVDGTSVFYDLLQGTQGFGNRDIVVSLVRNPQQIASGQRNYEWTATIEVPDGGLIISSDEQMYLAPQEGYQSQYVFHMPVMKSAWKSGAVPGWKDQKDVAIYLKLRGGKYYGRAELKFVAGAPRLTTPFYLTSYVNPSGSRNLEPPPPPPPLPPEKPTVFLNRQIGP